MLSGLSSTDVQELFESRSTDAEETLGSDGKNASKKRRHLVFVDDLNMAGATDKKFDGKICNNVNSFI